MKPNVSTNTAKSYLPRGQGTFESTDLSTEPKTGLIPPLICVIWQVTKESHSYQLPYSSQQPEGIVQTLLHTDYRFREVKQYA
jgi:hypothetical protein